MNENLEMFGGAQQRRLTRCPHCGSEILSMLGAMACTGCDFRLADRPMETRVLTKTSTRGSHDVPVAHFDGPEYTPDLDLVRLTGQIRRVYDLMRDGTWRTLGEISLQTGDPEASISAQLRHLRKKKFGAHIVDKRRRGDEETGLYEYRLSDEAV